jgi:hypothetical protein
MVSGVRCSSVTVVSVNTICLTQGHDPKMRGHAIIAHVCHHLLNLDHGIWLGPSKEAWGLASSVAVANLPEEYDERVVNGSLSRIMSWARAFFRVETLFNQHTRTSKRALHSAQSAVTRGNAHLITD